MPALRQQEIDSRNRPARLQSAFSFSRVYRPVWSEVVGSDGGHAEPTTSRGAALRLTETKNNLSFLVWRYSTTRTGCTCPWNRPRPQDMLRSHQDSPRGEQPLPGGAERNWLRTKGMMRSQPCRETNKPVPKGSGRRIIPSAPVYFSESNTQTHTHNTAFLGQRGTGLLSCIPGQRRVCVY